MAEELEKIVGSADATTPLLDPQEPLERAALQSAMDVPEVYKLFTGEDPATAGRFRPVVLKGRAAEIGPIELSPDDLDFFLGINAEQPAEKRQPANQVVAEHISDILQIKFPEYFKEGNPYDALRLPNSPFVRDFVEGIPNPEAGLSDEQIIDYFSDLKKLGEEGVPTRVEAFMRGFVPGLGGVGGLLYGAGLGSAFGGLPGAIVGGFSGAVGGSELPRYLIDQAFGTMDTTGLTPDAVAELKGYMEAGFVLPSAVVPAKLPTNFTGAGRFIDPVRKARSANLLSETRVMTEAEAASPLFSQYVKNLQRYTDEAVAEAQRAKEVVGPGRKIAAESKAYKDTIRSLPRRDRVGAFLENLVVSSGRAYQAATPAGKAAIIGTEATAAPLTGYLVKEAAEKDPTRETFLPETLYGSLGPMGAAVVFPLRHLISLNGPIANYVSDVRANVAEAGGGLRGLKEADIFGRRRKATQSILKKLSDLIPEYGDDPKAMADALEEFFFERVGTVGRSPTGRLERTESRELRPEFRDVFFDRDTGKRLPAGQRPMVFTEAGGEFVSGQRLEEMVLRSLTGARQENAQNRGFLRGLEATDILVAALKETGDPDLLRAANAMQAENLLQKMNARLDNEVDRVNNAFVQLGDPTPENIKNYANKVVGILEEETGVFRELQQAAWEEVPLRDVVPPNSFLAADGETKTNVPLFVAAFDDEVSRLSSAELSALSDNASFKALEKSVQDIKQKLGIPHIPTNVRANRPARSAADLAYAKEGNTPARQQFDYLMDQLDVRRYSPDNVQFLTDFHRAHTLRDPQDRADAINDLLMQRSRQQDPSSLFGNFNSADVFSSYAALSPEDMSSLTSLLDKQKQQMIELSGIADPSVSRSMMDLEEDLVVNDIVGARRNALAFVRQNPEFADRQRFGGIIQSMVMEDLMALPKVGEAYDNARNLSRAYNDFVTRTYTNDVLRKDRRGRQFIAEELFFQNLKSGGTEKAALRAKELTSLRDMIREQGKKYPGIVSQLDDIDTLDATLNDALKLLAADLTQDAAVKAGATGEDLANLQIKMARQFMVNNKTLLNDPRFSDLKATLERVAVGEESAETLLNAVRVKNERLSKRLAEDAALSAATKNRNPTTLVDAIFNAGDPEAQMKKILRRIKIPSDRISGRVMEQGSKGARIVKDQQQAINGFTPEDAYNSLKNNLIQYAEDRAGNPFSREVRGLTPEEAIRSSKPEVMYETLFMPPPNAGKKGKPLMEIMLDAGAVSPEDFRALEKSLSRMVVFKTNLLRKGKAPADFSQERPLLWDAYVRISGAKAGAMMGDIMPGGRGSGLIEGQVGSELAQKLFYGIPEILEADALYEIITDPKMAIQALRAVKSPEEGERVVEQIRRILQQKANYLFIQVPGRTGTRFAVPGAEEAEKEALEYIEEEPAPESEAPGQQGSVRPSAVPTRTVAAVQPPPIPPRPAPTPVPPSVASAPTQAPASPATRQRYAALFPNDPASSMIRSQGIGGLLG